MLRTIQHPHLRPRIVAGQVTTAGTAATFDIGGGDFTSSVSASSVATLTRAIGVIQPGPIIGSVGAGIADGGYFIFNTDPAITTLTGKTVDQAGTADDGTFDFMALDYHNEKTDRVAPLQTLTASSNGMRWIATRIASTGSAALAASNFSSVAKASSVYTLTFANAFARTPLVFCSPISSAQKALRVTSKSASAVAISAFSSAEAAQDNSFYALIVGWDRKDDTYGARRAVQIAQRKPRLEAFNVTGSGTAAITLGTTDATLVDNGTGDWTLTWTKAFAREPIVIVTGKNGRMQLAAAASTTSANVLGFDATGSAADMLFSMFVIGYDAADEI